ncbi:CHAT domain-containing protein [Baaleninema sp.]|uniref:CHAT domain-containing protein n=1 Tax=Baaleninema sp. TaxID=3101197 RepID=UPI003D08D072
MWELAVQGYDRADDRLNGALCRIYLSLGYQRLGRWEEARGLLERARSMLDGELDTEVQWKVYALFLNTLGQWQFNRGDAETALLTWQEAERAYGETGDEAGRLGSQINQGQALQTLGLYRRAKVLLDGVMERLEDSADSILKVRGLRSLGTVLHGMGRLREAQGVLERSLAAARALNDRTGIREALLSLSETARDWGNTETALEAYEWVARRSEGIDRLEVRLNQLRLWLDTDQLDKARSIVPEIIELLESLPPSRRLVYARVNLAESWWRLSPQDREGVAQLLVEAATEAGNLGDRRARSYSLGELGRLYERLGQLEEAQTLTERALALAQAIDASDLLARWQWQLGRVLVRQEDFDGAIFAYREAVAMLKVIRGDLASFDTDLRFSFRDLVEPVYREFVRLLLQKAELHQSTAPEQFNGLLAEARQTIESLQLAELDNFFREACLDVTPVSIDAIDPQAAVVYPIVLSDRLFVILSVAGQPLQLYSTAVSQAQVEERVAQLLESLHLAYSDVDRLEISQRLYDWLLKPAEPLLAREDVETLVFVLDGVLQKVPIAALYDGRQYLIERYAVALSPSLYLFAPESSLPERPQVLTGGLTESRGGFPPLPGVAREIEGITQYLPTQVLLDDDFTEGQLETEVRSRDFNIVHLATHGQFSSNADETFLLTWDGRLNVRELDRWLQVNRFGQAIDLLVLSACQTALGDDRAVLGLAGVAVRSGARSTLATLWSVRDRSTTQLMDEFYRQMTQQPRPSKAEALRQAQLHLLRESPYNHPFFWAPFVTIGNWR